MNNVHPRINDAYRQMKQHLAGGILPLWMESGLVSLATIGPRSKIRTEVSEKKP